MKKIICGGVALLLLGLIGIEITLQCTLRSESYPKSWSKIVALMEKKKHKRGDLGYRLYHQTPFIIPNFFWRSLRERKLNQIELYDREKIMERVNYYCKGDEPSELSSEAVTIEEFYEKEKDRDAWWYVFDLYEHLRFFPQKMRLLYRFGDITYIPEYRTIVKSRPIGENNQNSVLINLNKGRHFIFVNDKKNFKDKKDLLVWRGAAFQESRKRFIEQYQNHPMCDIADTNQLKTSNSKGYMSIDEQLEFKFVLSLEGTDVATNLKWILSSNSLCFAPKQRYETWFMEGKLIPNYHYVLIQDDYSDLIEKMEYYIKQTDEALAIIGHAHEYVKQFQDKKQEELIALLVLQKYLR